ncbi:conserved hypothetical protein, secreted [Candidatus Thiomargarita nelsonii]|uniref:VWFA domain-containing protein n=1 Tax=Candidatus Thiomargarita nelsonii TaxID=1003181 RepID=A0A0A6P159_9GAMM|nr:conserved hypothetical protein, secreted [Candidatus Thiomargarita nelsonii]
MLRIFVLISCLSLFLISTTVSALPDKGSCANYDFSSVMDKQGVIDTSRYVRVLRDNAPLYKEAESQTSNGQLGFGDYLYPLQVVKLNYGKQQRIQVRKVGTRTAPALGWMEAHDLLCGVKPLQSPDGLARKVFIKTPSRRDPSQSTVSAYKSYEQDCPSEGCQQLSRFRLYFIYAEDEINQRYLIIDKHTLEGHSSPPPLVGWVKRDDTIPWNTTLGLRPKEDVDRISTYIQLEDRHKKNRTEGVELTGGKIWYSFENHIPILKITEDHYHVAAPSIGMQGFDRYEEDILTRMKLVDVFFLIDGTASMDPHINAARQAVQEIGRNLRQQPDFAETSFRFGFRIYRDTYADNILSACQGGVCEGMSLSSKTCESDNDDTEANWQAFVRQLGKVKATHEKSDGYPEKLFDGLRQAILDMIPCDKRAKLLFVIGDHGDREDEVPQDIVDNLNNHFAKKLVFFIQTPNKSSQARTPSSYQKAYTAYNKQAFQVLYKILPTEFKGQRIQHGDYFLSLSQSSLITQVVERVKQYSSSRVVNELKQVLAGGESLQNILNRSVQQGGMPVMYWKWIQDTACSELGDQCNTTVDHKVVDFYIPVDKNKVQEEVWMTASNLDDWLSLLKPFENLGALPVWKQREVFAQLLRKQVQEILGAYPQQGLTLGEMAAQAKKKVLPMRQNGPLLQYKIEEIREEIEVCEVTRLINWVNAIRKVLQRVYNDSTQKPVFSLEYPKRKSRWWGGTDCPLSDKGKRVPELKFGRVVAQALGPDDNYRYDHRLYGQTVYWLPIDFLP